ncbi:hypothetical protein CFN78_16060 [Amycolatopsis antarctica]|uniref:Flagellar hook-length control protein FliK n=1 Tax=Amycolatopsis antarctica TaxID=1854586 RepID=A0A263D0W2_9PSEU|nr:hypothetical protein [Amycolatopsis antarctica]OZM72062.1 hypothetical protein CFN78_16060 [Amycolatopsis antarctica]
MRGLVAVAVLLVSSALPASAIDRGRGTPGYCADANGVTVVVDFQRLGGDVVIRCSPGVQDSGLAALQNAGFEVSGTDRWGPAFVCRLEGRPAADTEPCIDTPPADAYWSYWHAPNGGGWTSSQYGLMNRTPPPGTFEGWSFAEDRGENTGAAPRIAPVRPGQPVGPPPPPEAQNGVIPGREGPPRDDQPEPAPTQAAPDAPPSAQPASPMATAPPSTSAAVEDPVGGVAPGGVAWTGGEALPAADTGGFPWGALIGGLGALVLGSAAGILARRRRRARS